MPTDPYFFLERPFQILSFLFLVGHWEKKAKKMEAERVRKRRFLSFAFHFGRVVENKRELGSGAAANV